MTIAESQGGRTALRAAVRDSHAEVDALFSQFDLSSPAEYRRFLCAQAAAHLPVEAALERSGAAMILPDWAERRRGDLLAADLAELAATPAEAVAVPEFSDEAAVLGGVYVLEGSRLGGAFLKRSLGEGLPARFLGQSNGSASWRALLAVLDARLTAEAELERAAEAATAVFACFAEAARAELER